MITFETLEKLKTMIDPLIQTFLIVSVPIIALYFLNKLILPVSTTFRVIRFRGLPTTLEREKTTKQEAKWARHLLLISRSISTGEANDFELLQRFIIRTIIAFISTYAIYGYWVGLFDQATFKMSNLIDQSMIIISLMSGSLPYCIMRMRLHRVRVKNSYDLVPAVNTLLLKYGEYRGNLYYSLFETTKGLNGDILNAFVGLLPSLQGAAKSNIEDAIELFIFRIKTTWAIQLGILIHKSEEQGDNIELGLRWLITDMSEVAKITEEIKSENRETIQMAYMPAFLYPAVIVLNQYPSMGKSWHYYFQTEPGVRMLIFTFLFTLICALIAYIIQKPRNEV